VKLKPVELSLGDKDVASLPSRSSETKRSHSWVSSTVVHDRGLHCCAGAIIGANHHVNSDPLHLGVEPGPLGTTDPQAIEVHLGSEPSNRIVSISLSISSVQATNSGAENLELLTAPVTIEFTHSGIVTATCLEIICRCVIRRSCIKLRRPAHPLSAECRITQHPPEGLFPQEPLAG
jgi:hypothetical protein